MKKIIFYCLLYLAIFWSLSVFASHTASLANTRWQLTELMGKPISALSKTPYLILDKKTNKYSGFSGCNHIAGRYIAQKLNRLHFSQGASTLMACVNGMDTESQLIKVLSMTDSYSIYKKELQLYRARMAPLAKFEAVK